MKTGLKVRRLVSLNLLSVCPDMRNLSVFRYSVVRKNGKLVKSDQMDKIQSVIQADWPEAEAEKPSRKTDYYMFTVYKVNGNFACIVTETL